MNRYVIDGVARDAAAGKSVLLVGAMLLDASRTFAELLHRHPDEWRHVSRANGYQHAEHYSGGSVTVVAAGKALRGRSPDVAVALRWSRFTAQQSFEFGPLELPTSGVELVRVG